MQKTRCFAALSMTNRIVLKNAVCARMRKTRCFAALSMTNRIVLKNAVCARMQKTRCFAALSMTNRIVLKNAVCARMRKTRCFAALSMTNRIVQPALSNARTASRPEITGSTHHPNYRIAWQCVCALLRFDFKPQGNGLLDILQRLALCSPLTHTTRKHRALSNIY